MGTHDRVLQRPGPPDASGGAGEVHVLVVDDEAPIAAVVAEALAEMGYRVRVAANGRLALELVRAGWPDLVVTDLMMPELTGADLIVALRAEAGAVGRRPPPVILMTAAGRGHGVGVGADAVLHKPFDLDALEALAARLLGGPDRPYPPRR